MSREFFSPNQENRTTAKKDHGGPKEMIDSAGGIFEGESVCAFRYMRFDHAVIGTVERGDFPVEIGPPVFMVILIEDHCCWSVSQNIDFIAVERRGLKRDLIIKIEEIWKEKIAGIFAQVYQRKAELQRVLA